VPISFSGHDSRDRRKARIVALLRCPDLACNATDRNGIVFAPNVRGIPPIHTFASF